MIVESRQSYRLTNDHADAGRGAAPGQAVSSWLAAWSPSSAMDASRILNFWILPVNVIDAAEALLAQLSFFDQP